MNEELLQNLIKKIENKIDREVAIIDNNKQIILSTNKEIENKIDDNADYDKIKDDYQKIENYTYKCHKDNNGDRIYLRIKGIDEKSQVYINILLSSIEVIDNIVNKQENKDNLLKDIILENILPDEIELKCIRLKINLETKRRAIIIQKKSNEEVKLKKLLENVIDNSKNYVIIEIDNNEIVIVSDIKKEDDEKEIYDLMTKIKDKLEEEDIDLIISIGEKVQDIKQLNKSYKKAREVINYSNIFKFEDKIINYKKLGLTKLIYGIKETICEEFLKENVKKKDFLEQLDNELLHTMKVFLDNNLNISETARELFIHRNTLLYRIQTIKSKTGFDIRNYNEAVLLELSIMTKRYLKSIK